MSTVNGREFQHATVDLQVIGRGGSFQLVTFTKISYKDKGEKKPVLNAQGKIIGYTIDNQNTEGAVSMLLSEWFQLKEWVQQQYPDVGIGQVEFEFSIVFGPSPTNYKTDKLRGVMFNEEPRDSESNQEALAVELPLFIGKIEPHGGSFIQYA